MNELFEEMLQILRNMSLREWLEGIAFAVTVILFTIGALIIGG